MGTDGPTDRPMDGPTDRPTDGVSYRGAILRLKTGKVNKCQSNGITLNSTNTQIKKGAGTLSSPPDLTGLFINGNSLMYELQKFVLFYVTVRRLVDQGVLIKFTIYHAAKKKHNPK
jgi:hypothetical protein